MKKKNRILGYFLSMREKKNRILGYFLSMRWILLTQMNTYVGFGLLAQQEIS